MLRLIIGMWLSGTSSIAADIDSEPFPNAQTLVFSSPGIRQRPQSAACPVKNAQSARSKISI